MYIYSAQLQAKPGRGAEAGAKIAELRDAVSAATGRPAYGWAVVAGGPIGAFGVSLRVDGVADLIDMQTKLGANGDYAQLATEIGGLWAEPAQTSLVQVVGTAGELGDPEPVITVTRSTISAGHVADALAWSNEVMEFVAGATGLSGVLATSVAGSFFDVSWIFGSDSGAASDAANDALLANPDYMGLIDRAGGLFIEGSAERVILSQLP